MQDGLPVQMSWTRIVVGFVILMVLVWFIYLAVAKANDAIGPVGPSRPGVVAHREMRHTAPVR